MMATREELVVPAELSCSAAAALVSISAAGAAANPFVGTAVVVLTELVVVVTLATLFALAGVGTDAAATLGTAVHRRPSMVVRNAPDGRPLDAIVKSRLRKESRYAKPVASERREMGCRRRQETSKIQAEKGVEEANIMAARAV